MEDVDHDLLQLSINFFECPGQTLAVLRHFQTRGSYAACVCCLCRSKQDACSQELVDCFRSRRHICTFCYDLNAILQQDVSRLAVDLVLGCTRQSNIALDGPDALAAFGIGSAVYTVYIFLDASTFYFLDLLYNIQLDAVRIVDVAVGVRQCNNLCAHFLCLSVA